MFFLLLAPDVMKSHSDIFVAREPIKSAILQKFVKTSS